MRWIFFQDDLGRWRWEHEQDGVTTECAGSGFADEAQCVADAERHGYAAVEAGIASDEKA